MTRVLAVAAAGADQPTATTAKIKTASHTEFLTVPGSPFGIRTHLVQQEPNPDLEARVTPLQFARNLRSDELQP